MMVAATVAVWYASADVPAVAKGAGGNLEVVADAGIVLSPSETGLVSAVGGGDFWAVHLETATRPSLREKRTVIMQREQKERFETIPGGGFRLVYDQLRKGRDVWDIRLTFEFRAVENRFEISGEMENNAPGWRVAGVDGPVIRGLSVKQPEYGILLPEGFGYRINRAPTQEKPGRWKQHGDRWEVTHNWAYPSCYGSMQWMAFASERDGFYYGCHDPDHTAKRLIARYYPETGLYGATSESRFFVECGAKRVLPKVVIMSYKGAWRQAADVYRAWYEACHPAQQRQAWVDETVGWLLVILKQQNGEIMWNYDDLGELADIAKARGIDALGIFGWSHGGHDNLFPDDRPDPLMGGEERLKRGLAECRKRGVKTILYANGQLQQRDDSEFWRNVGRNLTVEKRDGSLYFETYHKYREVPVYVFELACQHSEAWYQQMLHLAKQAEGLGADGIIFDQLAITRPMECYGRGHGHDGGPVMTYENDRAKLIRRLAGEMRRINPAFTFVTEGLNDSNLADVALFHACQTGGFRVTDSEMRGRLVHAGVQEVFPEMIRYTHPNVITTVRMPTPASDRAMVNYTALYGFRTDIESRYGPDVPYLREGRIPEKEDYGMVIHPPDLQLMSSAPAAEHVRYMRIVHDFLRANADLVFTGRFIDKNGFVLDVATPVVSAGYRSKDDSAFGVMLWNPNNTPVACRVSVSGKSIQNVSEPEAGNVAADAPLAPYTLRLYRFGSSR